MMVPVVVVVIVIVVVVMVMVVIVSLGSAIPRDHLDPMMVPTASLHDHRVPVSPIDKYVHIAMVAVVVVPPLGGLVRFLRCSSFGSEERPAEGGERAGECASSLGLGLSGRVDAHGRFAMVYRAAQCAWSVDK